MARAEGIPAQVDTLPEAVAWHARTTPDGHAVTGGEGPVGFARFDAMADRVAAALAAHSLRPGEPVLLHGELSAWTVASAVAVMRAGGAVVPVGPADPPARVSLIVEDCRARLGLSTRPSRFPAHAVDQVLDPSDPGLPQAAVRPGSAPGAEDLAYILFTSGSTGRPKGVMIEHRNLMHYLRAAAERYRLDGAVPPLPALTPMSFDASVLQVYAPLARGADVWLVPPSAREEPAELLAALAGRPGSGLHCVPSLWAEVLRELGAAPAASAPLRALLLGGEVVPRELWAQTRRALPDTALANVYGPTEATVQATGGWHDPHEAPGDTHAPHTGLPLDGVGVRVRSPEGATLGPGERGEVHVFGPGVGRGYVARPDLTAASFHDEPGLGRVYRTGDEGFLDEAGRLTVTGRLDEQIKVRGYRVEPGETEAALRSAPGVSDAAVTVLAPGTSSARLVAAVTPAAPHAGGPLTEDQLREVCRGRLAPHLVPARIRIVPALPRLANGKVDRAAVRALFTAATPPPAPAKAVPDSERERLRALWQALLDVETVRDGDDFFSLGGHSLLATRLIGRTRKELGRPVPLHVIFKNRTFDAFAHAVGADQDTGAKPPAPAHEPAPVPDDLPVPLTLQQRALWALHRAMPEVPSSHVMLPLQLTGPVTRDLVDSVVRTLLADHPTLRGIVDDAGEVTVRPLSDVDPPLTETDLRDDPRRERRLVQHARTLYLRPFSLTDAIPLRAAWLRMTEERSVLLLCIHHLACDGTSLGILAAEARALFNGAAPARPAGPRPGHRGYAVWQRRRWDAGELAGSLAHWVAHLERGAEDIGWSGQGTTPPAERTYASHMLGLPAATGLAAALRRTSAARGTTVFTLCAAALGLAVHRVTGVKELVIGMLSDGRSRPEFEDAVGLFAGTLAVRLPLDDDDPARLLAATGEAVLTAQTHGDVPLDIAAEHLRGGALTAGDPFGVGLSVDWAVHEVPDLHQSIRVRVVPPDAKDIRGGVGSASCALTVFLRREGDDVSVGAEYMADLLDEATARCVLEDMVRTLVSWTSR